MRIILVGNQNSGKTSLFNLLTGNSQKVGNWPGVTIEKKSGTIKGTNHQLLDLPGIYSLYPYTKEEEITVEYLFNRQFDLVLNVIDVTALERSLYLTYQLLELDCPMIIVFNMCDLLDKNGILVNYYKLEEILQTKIFPISALKRAGIDKLISSLSETPKVNHQYQKIFPLLIESDILKLSLKLNDNRFSVMKIIEGNEKINKYQQEVDDIRLKIINYYHFQDIEEIIAGLKYSHIEKTLQKVLVINSKKENISDKIDKLFLNKYLAIPLFIIIMGLVYFLSVSSYVGGGMASQITNFFNNLSKKLEIIFESMNLENWIISLICNGMIMGVSSVLSFVPQLIILFTCLAFLETSGYMSRIVFFFDKMLRSLGLSGKSLISFIVGSGCSVPAILATRTIKDDKGRDMTIFLTPLIPCSAKLPVIILFASFFVRKNIVFITIIFYFLAIIMIILSACIWNKLLIKKSTTSFLVELPQYKIPSFRYIFDDVYSKSKEFIKRAGTVVLLSSIIVWFLLSFTRSFQYTDDKWRDFENNQLSNYLENCGLDKYDDCQIKYENGKIIIRFYLEEKWTIWYNFNDVISPELNLVEGKELYLAIQNDKIVYKYVYGIDNSLLADIGNTFSFVFYPIIGELNWGMTVSAIQGMVAKEQIISSLAVIANFSFDSHDKKQIFDSPAFASITPLAGFCFLFFNIFCAPCFAAMVAMAKEFQSRKKFLLVITFQTCFAWFIASALYCFGSFLKWIF